METVKYRQITPVSNEVKTIQRKNIELIDVKVQKVINQNKTIVIYEKPLLKKCAPCKRILSKRNVSLHEKNGDDLRYPKINSKLHSRRNLIDYKTKINVPTFKKQLNNTSDIVQKLNLAPSSKHQMMDYVDRLHITNKYHYHVSQTFKIFEQPLHRTLNAQLSQMFINHCTTRKVLNVDNDSDCNIKEVQEIDFIKHEIIDEQVEPLIINHCTTRKVPNADNDSDCNIKENQEIDFMKHEIIDEKVEPLIIINHCTTKKVPNVDNDSDIKEIQEIDFMKHERVEPLIDHDYF